MASTQSVDKYPLKRNYIGSARLNLNHFWLKSLTGYLVHPKIPTDKKDLRIIDIGTSTGIWACELATQLPNAAIDATDISAAQFPPKGFYPSNLRFWTHNAMEPFPEEYLGKFDIVAVKFWLCILNDGVAEKVLDNFLTLLKPGGYLQWFEPLPETAHVVSHNGGKPTPACDRMVSLWKKPSPSSEYAWIHALPKLFEERGLEMVAEEKHTTLDYYLPISAQASIMGLAEYSGQSPEIQQYQEELTKEHAEGALVDVTMSCRVGRLPKE